MANIAYRQIRNRIEDAKIRKLHSCLGGSGAHDKYLQPDFKFHADHTCTIVGYYIDGNFTGSVSEVYGYLCDQVKNCFDQVMAKYR